MQGNSPEIAEVTVQSERTQCGKRRGKSPQTFHCWAEAPQRPHPVLLWASSMSGMPPPSAPRPAQGLPVPTKPQGEARLYPCALTPQESGKQRAQSRAGHFATLLQGLADHRVGWVPLLASRGPHFQSLPAPRSAPQPRGHSGRPGRAPLTWAGHLTLRASLEAEQPGWAGWGFYTRPILPARGCPASPPSLACSHPAG